MWRRESLPVNRIVDTTLRHFLMEAGRSSLLKMFIQNVNTDLGKSPRPMLRAERIWSKRVTKGSQRCLTPLDQQSRIRIFRLAH